MRLDWFFKYPSCCHMGNGLQGGSSGYREPTKKAKDDGLNQGGENGWTVRNKTHLPPSPGGIPFSEMRHPSLWVIFVPSVVKTNFFQLPFN